MDISSALKLVEKHKGHKVVAKKAFLAHAFVLVDAGVEEWQIGFFDQKADRMISFIVGADGAEVQELPPAEVLKGKDKIQALNPEDVKLAPADALAKAAEVNKEHYKGVPSIKTFYIIQDLGEGPIYNITFVTQSFTTMNIRISAKDGTVLKHSNEPLLSFDKPLDKTTLRK